MDQGDRSQSSRKAGRRIAAASQGVAGRRRRRVRRIRETVSQGGVARCCREAASQGKTDQGDAGRRCKKTDPGVAGR